jgi:hypothetical protein
MGAYFDSAGTVRFGSGSGHFALNAEPEPGVRFGVRTRSEPEKFGHLGDLKICLGSCLIRVNFGGEQVNKANETR